MKSVSPVKTIAASEADSEFETKKEMESEEWNSKLKEMIPTYGQSLKDNPELCRETRQKTHAVLELKVCETVI